MQGQKESETLLSLSITESWWVIVNVTYKVMYDDVYKLNDVHVFL